MNLENSSSPCLRSLRRLLTPGSNRRATGLDIKFYIWMERSILRAQCLDQEYSTMFPARARTRTVQVSHKATAPKAPKTQMHARTRDYFDVSPTFSNAISLFLPLQVSSSTKLNSTNRVLIPKMFCIRALTVERFPAVSSCRILTSSITLSLACFCVLPCCCVLAINDSGLKSSTTLESKVLSPGSFCQLSCRGFETKK